jgi:hypothetical protein
VNWEVIKWFVVAVLSAGGALSIKAMFSGADLWRSGTARTEARGIANLQLWREKAEHDTLVALHRLEFVRDEKVPYLMTRIAVLERVIIVNLGQDAVPLAPPEPMMRPLPALPAELEEKVTGDVDA